MPNIVKAIQRETAERRQERRFLLSEETARLAMRTVSTHLSLVREDSPYQWSTTVYCDTYDWQAYQAAERGESLQLRFREYHRARPNRVLSAARTWIELKDDSRASSVKERFAVAGRYIPAFLRGEPILQDHMEQSELLARGQAFIRAGARPVIVTQYNRIAHAGPQDRVRITADHNLMYLAIPWASSDDRSVPCRIGPVLAREPKVLLEVKWFDELPDWASQLREWIEEGTHDERPTKFVVGMRHLLGLRQAS
jgi:hypothetical protein